MHTRAKSTMTTTGATRPTATTTTTTAGMSANPTTNTSAVNDPGHFIPPAEPREDRSAHVIYARLPMPTVTNTNIEAWFTSMEYWFDASGITADRQRFSTILAAIDPNVLAQLMEILREEPVLGKYEFIKLKLIAHFADSEQRKLNRLLSEMPLGDKRPSELYHEMKRVAGNVLGEAALKGLWSQRLPEAARPVIAASTGTAAEFTRIADSIVDALAPRTINAATTTTALSELDELKAVIAELRQQIQSFPQRVRLRSRGTANQRPRTPTNNGTNASTNANNNTESDECWYHQKYGRNARNCRSPCRHNRNRQRVGIPTTVAAETNTNA